jgi:hypothetical protein
MLLRLTSRLSPKATGHAVEMIRELADFLAENDDPDAENVRSLTIAFVPLAG